MFRSILLTGLLLMIGETIATAQEGPKFKTLILPDSIRFVQIFSEDKRVGTMLFDNFILGTEIGQGTLPSTATKKFTYVLHPESDKEVCVVQHIRGYVNTQGTGSAAFVVHAGGKTTTVDFAKAIKAAKNGDKPAHIEIQKTAKRLATEQGFTVDGRPNKSDDFFVEIKSHVAVGKPLQTSYLMLVDRLPGDDGSGAAVHIDSIDFEVIPIEKSKK